MCISTALIQLSGCAVEIKNERWYGDEGPLGAHYFETLTSAEGDVSKDIWDQIRVGMACTDIDTIAEIKQEIEQLCSLSNACSYDQVHAQLEDILARFRAIQVRAVPQ